MKIKRIHPLDDWRRLGFDFYERLLCEADGYSKRGFEEQNRFTLFVFAFLLALSPVIAQAQSSFQYDANGNLTNVITTIAEPPTITVPPVNQNVIPGEKVALSISAIGPGPISYQWLQSGVLVQGATNSTLFLPSMTFSNQGSYSVVVCNGSGCVTSTVPALLQFASTWVGSASSDWYNPSNWFPPIVPTGFNSITIPAGADVTLTAPATITGNLNWFGGTMLGDALTVASNGIMNLSGGVTFVNALTNEGTVNWLDNFVNFNGCAGSGLLVNLAGAVWNIQCDQAMNINGCTSSGNFAFQNFGTVEKTANTGTTSIQVPFYNLGTVSALEGDLNFNNGGTVSGTYNAGAGTTILFSGGSFSYSIAPALNGPGAIELTGGSLSLASNVLPNLEMVGGTITLETNFQGGEITNLTLMGVSLGGAVGIAKNGVLSLNGGALNGSVTIPSGAILNLNNGSVDFSAPVTSYGTINLDNETLTGNPLTIASTGIMNLNGGVTFVNALTNAGTVNWLGSSVNFNSCAGSGLIVNLAGAVWNIQCDQSISIVGGCNPSVSNFSFQNYGTLQKTASIGTTSIQVPFYNSGTVDVELGLVQLSGENTLTGGTLNFGINSLTSFGQISISGNAAFSGALGVHFNNGYTPITGNSFGLLSYGSESGLFAPLNLPSNMAWQTNYGSTQFTLAVLGVGPVLLPSLVTNAAPKQRPEFLLQFTGSTNSLYTVLASTNLALPFSNWATLGNASLLSNTLYQFIDTQSTNFPARFYMLRSP